MATHLSALDLEAISNWVLAATWPAYYYAPAPGRLDIELFAEIVLGATLDYAPLSQDKSILGLTCFERREVQIWNEDRTQPLRRMGERRLIMLDPDVWEERGSKSGRFTVAHEVSHIILHESEQSELACSGPNPEVSPALPISVAKGTSRLKTDSDWREWQANRLAAALLMPHPKILAALPWFSTYIEGQFQIQPVGVARMAELFDVSRKAMRCRLDDIDRAGLINARIAQIAPQQSLPTKEVA